MKVSFFKDESYFYSPSTRISYFWKNAEQVKTNKKSNKTRKMRPSILDWILGICCFIFAFVLLFFKKTSWVFILMPFIIFPLHEFCHILYALIIKKKVIGICFLPYNCEFTLFKPMAYIKFDFNYIKKIHLIMLSIFPLILLTILPYLFSIFIPSLWHYLFGIAVLNFLYSIYDILNFYHILRMPKNASFFFECGWLMPTNNQPVSIHRLIKINNEDKLLHEQWLFADYQLTKVDEPEIDESVELFVNDFQKQFGANCHI